MWREGAHTKIVVGTRSGTDTWAWVWSDCGPTVVGDVCVCPSVRAWGFCGVGCLCHIRVCERVEGWGCVFSRGVRAVLCVCVGAVIKLCVRIPMLVVYMCASKR